MEKRGEGGMDSQQQIMIKSANQVLPLDFYKSKFKEIINA